MEKKYYKPAFERASDEYKTAVLTAGINEFSDLGLEKANINVIAKKAGVSVGLLYKYFDAKEDFFYTCVDEAIKQLEITIQSVVDTDDKILVRAEKLIRAIQRFSNKDTKYLKLYNEITKLKGPMADFFVKRIESISSKTYLEFIERAKENGEIRQDCDTRLFTFFFDSLLVALQFSYSCDYFIERLKVFCGEEIFEDDDLMVAELLKFLESAFTFEQTDIKRLGR
ncbi:MAG: TetR/AcrR family transcriptional regulator [Ruminococcaceae bacterium]|nr:TetR/AcrR family transcriptional regulator [Oscillospiraceae bacterium]